MKLLLLLPFASALVAVTGERFTLQLEPALAYHAALGDAGSNRLLLRPVGSAVDDRGCRPSREGSSSSSMVCGGSLALQWSRYDGIDFSVRAGRGREILLRQGRRLVEFGAMDENCTREAVLLEKNIKRRKVRVAGSDAESLLQQYHPEHSILQITECGFRTRLEFRPDDSTNATASLLAVSEIRWSVGFRDALANQTAQQRLTFVTAGPMWIDTPFSDQSFAPINGTPSPSSRSAGPSTDAPSDARKEPKTRPPRTARPKSRPPTRHPTTRRPSATTAPTASERPSASGPPSFTSHFNYLELKMRPALEYQEAWGNAALRFKVTSPQPVHTSCHKDCRWRRTLQQEDETLGDYNDGYAHDDNYDYESYDYDCPRDCYEKFPLNFKSSTGMEISFETEPGHEILLQRRTEFQAYFRLTVEECSQPANLISLQSGRESNVQIVGSSTEHLYNSLDLDYSEFAITDCGFDGMIFFMPVEGYEYPEESFSKLSISFPFTDQAGFLQSLPELNFTSRGMMITPFHGVIIDHRNGTVVYPTTNPSEPSYMPVEPPNYEQPPRPWHSQEPSHPTPDDAEESCNRTGTAVLKKMTVSFEFEFH